MFQKKKKEVFLANDPVRFAHVQAALKEAGIPFQTETVNTGSQNRRTGVVWGRMGENVNVEILYYIYVSPEDESRAKQVVTDCTRNFQNNG